jgi:hypothetical protein
MATRKKSAERWSRVAAPPQQHTRHVHAVALILPCRSGHDTSLLLLLIRRHALQLPSVEISLRPGFNPTLTLLANAGNPPSHGAHGTIHHGFQGIPNRSPAVSTLMTRGNTPSWSHAEASQEASDVHGTRRGARRLPQERGVLWGRTYPAPSIC